MKYIHRSFWVLLPAVILSCSLFMPEPQPTEPAEEPLFGPTAGPLTFEHEVLPAAQKGEAYEVEIRVLQNVTPVGDFFVSAGNLPAGLELTFLEGEDAAVISGIPQENGSFNFTLTVWCFGTQVSGQEGIKEYLLVVN